MDEAKRLIRFILPGLVYVILLLLTWIILNTDDALQKLSLVKDVSFVGFLATLVLSGGLGYIFSIIYFGFFWLTKAKNKSHIYDHLDLIKKLVASNKLKLTKLNSNGDEEDFKIVHKRDAFYIMNVLWHSHTGEHSDSAIKSVSKKFDTYFSDVATGLATTWIAIILSFITSVVLYCKYYHSCSSHISVLWCLLIYAALFYLVYTNHKRTYKMYQAIANTTLASEILQKEDKYLPIKIVFSE